LRTIRKRNDSDLDMAIIDIKRGIEYIQSRHPQEEIIMLFGTVENAIEDPGLELPEGGRLRVRSLLDTFRYVVEKGSQVFLVDQAPEAILRPHFHPVAQFQVVVAGSGHLGRRPVEPFEIHFADPGTPYGPITPGVNGLSYVTLRPDHTAQTFWMPESRAAMKRRPGRNVHARFSPRPKATQLEVLVERHPDGLAAFGLCLAGHRAFSGPPAFGSGGQYYLITRGSLIHEDREYRGLAVAFVDPADGRFEGRTGGDGLDAIILQFPRYSEAPES
jgi:hypothetical protein